MASLYKPGGFLRSPRLTFAVKKANKMMMKRFYKRNPACTSPNLSRLITAYVPQENFLRMSYYRPSSNPRIVLFVTTMNHKAKLSQWITKEKYFSSRTCPSGRSFSSSLTRTLVRADASIASVSHLHCSLSSGLHCTPIINVTNTSCSNAPMPQWMLQKL